MKKKKRRVAKKITALALSFVMAMGSMLSTYAENVVGEVEANAGFAGGTGIESDPYIIKTAAQLDNVRNDLNASYVLDANIDLGSIESWNPIGNSKEPFLGNFNGNGFVISNINININIKTDVDYTDIYTGLFGLAESATIKNLGVENSKYIINSVDLNSIHFSNAGGIVGNASNSIIENCYFQGEINNSVGKNVYSRVGGIAGTTTNTNITNCYSNSEIYGSAYNTNTMAGGISAWVEGTTVDKCYVTGSVEAKNTSSYCYVGGISASGVGTIQNCVSIVEKLIANGITNKKDDIGCFSTKLNNNVLRYDSEASQEQSTYENLGWDFNLVWEMSNTYPTLSIFKKIFTIGRDNNKFDNASYDFFNEGEEENYIVNSKKYRIALYNNQSVGDRYSLLYRENQEWNGSCYGLSLAVMLAYYDEYDISKYINEDNKDYPYFSNVNKPKDDSNMKDLIQILQLSQYRSDVYYTNKSYGYGLNKLIGSGTDMETFLKEIVEEAKDSNYLKPFMLCVTYKNGGHALVVCGSEGIVNGYYKIAICDPNGHPLVVNDEPVYWEHTKYNYLMIKDDYSEFYMENGNGDIIYKNEIDSENYKCIKYFTYDDAFKGKLSDNEDGCRITVDGDSSFYMTTDKGTYLKYDGETFSGTVEIEDFSAIVSGESEDNTSGWVIDLSGVNGISFSELSDEVEVDCMFDDDEYINVTGVNLTQIAFTDNEGVVIDGNNASYEISIGAKDEENTLISISGKTSNDVSFIYKGEDISVKGIEEISDMNINKITENGKEEVDENKDPQVILTTIYTLGDADSDGGVTSADAVIIKKYLAGYSDLNIDEEAGDVDGDGEITSADTVLLLKYLAGYDVELK